MCYLTESIRAIYSPCQFIRPLHVSVKQDNLITLGEGRLTNLFGNLNWFIFARRLIFVILMLIVILIFIYIWWYLQLLDVCNQKNLHILRLVYVVIRLKRNILLFPGKRVTRKILTQAATNPFFKSI